MTASLIDALTAADLLPRVESAGILARGNPTEENVENFVMTKKVFNTACREMKYHAMDLSMARQYLRDGQYRLNKILTQYGDLPPKFHSTPTLSI